MAKNKKRIAIGGYTEWATDSEILKLAADMSKSDMKISQNQALIALRAMECILNRIPTDSETCNQLEKIGQEFYNLLGHIASAHDYSNGY